MLRKRLLTVIACLMLLLVFPLPVSSQDGANVLITGITAGNFPEIQLTFYARDANNQVLTGLTPDDFFIYESGIEVENFDLETRDDTPMTVIFVIDLGRYSNYNAFGLDSIRRALTRLVEGGHFRDGQDTVEILGRVNNTGTEETVTLLRATPNATEFVDFVNLTDFASSFGATQALRGVESALTRMPELTPSDQTVTAIVLLTPFIDSLRNVDAIDYAEGVAEVAAGQGVSIYALHTHLLGELPEPLETLAGGTGGQYLRLLKDTDLTTELDRFYGSLAAQRGYYAATYHSTSGAPGPREVVVSLDTPAGFVSDSASYEIVLQPPAISIVQPGQGENVSLTIEESEDGQPVITPGSLAIVANLGPWTDGISRHITQAELLVDSQPVDSLTPAPADTRFQFTWAIPPVDPGSLASFSYQVRVRDEFGLEATSDPVTVSFAVAEVEQQPGFIRACLANPFRLSCAAAVILPVVVVLGLVVVAGVILIRRQSRAKAMGIPGDIPAGRPAGRPVSGFETLVGAEDEPAGFSGPQALATLRVIEGPADVKGTTIPVFEELTKIGRNPDLTDVTFYRDEQSSVSSQHCTLQYFRGSFFLSDNNSRNGTTVNGQPLVPGRPHSLHDGDRIVLGNLPLKGVELEFSVGGAGDGKTMIASHLDVTFDDLGLTQAEAAPYKEGRPDRTVLEMDDYDEFNQSSSQKGEDADDGWIDQLG